MPPDLSHFASILTVRDIFSPFIGAFEANRTVSEVWDAWYELSFDSCPLEQAGLVLEDKKPAGILHYEDLISGSSISDCMMPIPLDALITEETSLLAVAEMFARSDVQYFVVLRENDFVGWLSYHDLHKLPFRLCLFAALLGIEEKMLQVVLRNAQVAIGKLPSQRRNSARRLYNKRYAGSSPEFEHEPWAGIASCTYFSDKAFMLKECGQTRTLIPAVCEERWVNLVTEVRNALAHPDPSKHFAIIVERNRFAGFINWLGRIDTELIDFLNSDAPLELP